MQWREERSWSAGRYRISVRGERFVAEYEFASWFDAVLMRARQFCELGALATLEAAQRVCARHSRRCKKGEAA